MFTNPIQCQFTAQIHHLDIDYYRSMHGGSVVEIGAENPPIMNINCNYLGV